MFSGGIAANQSAAEGGWMRPVTSSQSRRGCRTTLLFKERPSYFHSFICVAFQKASNAQLEYEDMKTLAVEPPRAAHKHHQEPPPWHRSSFTPRSPQITPCPPHPHPISLSPGHPANQKSLKLCFSLAHQNQCNSICLFLLPKDKALWTLTQC